MNDQRGPTSERGDFVAVVPLIRSTSPWGTKPSQVVAHSTLGDLLIVQVRSVIAAFDNATVEAKEVEE